MPLRLTCERETNGKIPTSLILFSSSFYDYMRRCVAWRVYSTLVAFFCGLLQIIDNFLSLIRQKGEQRERSEEVLTVGEEKKDEKIKFTACLSLFLECNKKKDQPEDKMHKEGF